jgi:hypothetical protein
MSRAPRNNGVQARHGGGAHRPHAGHRGDQPAAGLTALYRMAEQAPFYVFVAFIFTDGTTPITA